MTRMFVPNPGGEFYDPRTGRVFIPSGATTAGGVNMSVSNPMVWGKWGKVNSARLIVGLTTGRRTAEYPHKGSKVNPKLVRALVRTLRTDAVGVGYGASFVLQQGHWMDKKTGKFVDEMGIQILIFPAQREAWHSFVKSIRGIATELGDAFAQDTIIVDFVRQGKSAGLFAAEFRKAVRSRRRK